MHETVPKRHNQDQWNIELKRENKNCDGHTYASYACVRSSCNYAPVEYLRARYLTCQFHPFIIPMLIFTILEFFHSELWDFIYKTYPQFLCCTLSYTKHIQNFYVVHYPMQSISTIIMLYIILCKAYPQFLCCTLSYTKHIHNSYVVHYPIQSISTILMLYIILYKAYPQFLCCTLSQFCFDRNSYCYIFLQNSLYLD